MKIAVDIRCKCPNPKCGFVGRVTCYGSDNWRGNCPDCQAYIHHPDPPHPAEEVREACQRSQAMAKMREDMGLSIRGDGNRRFDGSESVSVTEGYNPAEVKFAKRHLSQNGYQIHDNGSVSFNDRRGERRHTQDLAKLKRRMGVPED